MVIFVNDAKNLDEQLPNLIEKLRQQLKDNKQMKVLKHRTDDDFLIKFLRVRDYDVTRALNGIRKYYRNIERNQDIIIGIRPSQFISVFDANITYILKHKDRFGSSVGIARPGAWDTTKINLRQIQLASLLLAEEKIQDKDTQLNGVAVIFDMQDFSFQHIRQLSATEIRRIILTAQEGLPLKVKAVHFINYPSIFWAVYYIVQGFLKEKIRNRTHLHSSVESLHEFISADALPKSLGGNLELEEAIDKELLARVLEKDLKYEDLYQ